ncbi:MAG: Fungalysin metallopeptidase-domain-containing protein, partial [Olpidium bornovanus]
MKSGPFVSAVFLLGALAPSTGRSTAEAHPFKGGYRQRPGPPPFGPTVEARDRSSSRFLGGESPFADLRDQTAFAESLVRDPRTPSLAVEETVERFARLHGFLPKDYLISNAYTSDHNKVTHVYLKQIVNGLPVANADMNLNIDRQGRVFSYGDSFFRGRKPDPVGTAVTAGYGGLPPPNGGSFGPLDHRFAQFQKLFAPAPEPPPLSSDAGGQGLLSPKDALLMLSRHLNVEIRNADDIQMSLRASRTSDEPSRVLTNVPFTLNGEAPNRMTYIQTGDGKLELVHEFELEMQENWYSAHVSAVTGKVISLVDWTADASYTVFPLGYNDPRDGPRAHVLDPADDVASPLGWHSQGDDKNFTTTVGNNVYAHENLECVSWSTPRALRGSYGWENNHRPDGRKDLIFNNPLDLTEQPKESIDAAITNLFYWNNVVSGPCDGRRFSFRRKACANGSDGSDGYFAPAARFADRFTICFTGTGSTKRPAISKRTILSEEGRMATLSSQTLKTEAVLTIKLFDALASPLHLFASANFATPPDGQRGKMRM